MSCSFRISSIAGVYRGSGPSSKVRAISFSLVLAEQKTFRYNPEHTQNEAAMTRARLTTKRKRTSQILSKANAHPNAMISIEQMRIVNTAFL
jgi:hypothetical protein